MFSLPLVPLLDPYHINVRDWIKHHSRAQTQFCLKLLKKCNRKLKVLYDINVYLFYLQIDMQPNPVEIFQIVYDQGLCTMCAPFYIAWADELDKNDDIKLADQIFELGIRVQAQPLELLKEAHL